MAMMSFAYYVAIMDLTRLLGEAFKEADEAKMTARELGMLDLMARLHKEAGDAQTVQAVKDIVRSAELAKVDGPIQ